MLRVNPIRGGRDAVNYYAALVREAGDGPREQDDGAGADGHRDNRGGERDRGRDDAAAEDYYLAAPEEGGRWWGQGTRALGLQGLGTREELHALFAGQHPSTGCQLGQRPAERTIRAYDLTFSAPKTVSLLASLCGGDLEHEVLDAHDRAVEATLSILQERTTTRGGKGGRVRLDTGGLAVLLVRHRTSRALDPQLHTHALVIARVQGSDGRWRSLDASTAMRGVMTFGAIYQSALRAELHRRLPGIAFAEVVKGQAEIAGLDELKSAFSKRTRQAKRKYEVLLAQWRERDPGCELSLREESRLRRQAACRSRPAKERARTLDALRADWLSHASELGLDVPRAIERALQPERTVEHPAATRQEIAQAAIDALAAERSVFSREHVERQIAIRIDHTAGRSAAAQARAIEALAAKAIESLCIDLAALGERSQQRLLALAREPALERYTTRALLAEEQQLCRFLDAVAARGGEPASGGRIARALAELVREHPDLPQPEPEQVRTAALIAGSHRACAIVGPAGAGKTTTLRLAARALSQERREVLVLAPWARAAAAAREATGLPAENVSRYLKERSREDGGRAELRLRPGGTLVIDEAGTLPTPDWRALCRTAAEDHLRLVFIGDQRQLAAVGRGGVFGAALERLESVELSRVHRFESLWERQASLDLRAGNAHALDSYEEHGRVFSGAGDQVQERMLADWHQAHRAGRSYAFCVPTRAQAQQLNERAQKHLIAAGELDASRALNTSREQSLHVGDLVQTRRNERRPEVVRGGQVRNRETWTVRAIGEDGSLTLGRGQSGRAVTLAPGYAREQVELSYFSTVHAVQGRTVARGGVLVDEHAGFRSLYVGMTRGRQENTAYVVSDGNATAREILERALVRDRADLGVLAQARTLAELARRRQSLEPPERRPEKRVPERTAPEIAPARRFGPPVRDRRLVLGGRGRERERGIEPPGLGIEL